MISTITPEKAQANIAAAMERGLPIFLPSGSRRGPAILVGGGASVESSWTKIEELAAKGIPIFALKGAWRTLARFGIKTDAIIILDGHPSQAFYVPKTPGPKLLLASQCAPETFDAATGHEVAIWHAPMLNKAKEGGGIASRAIKLLGIDGYAPLHGFGIECSAANPWYSHSYELARPDAKAPLKDTIWIDREFISSEPMVAEAQAIIEMAVNRDGPPMIVYDGGMLAYGLLRARERMGELTLEEMPRFVAAEPEPQFGDGIELEFA